MNVQSESRRVTDAPVLKFIIPVVQSVIGAATLAVSTFIFGNINDIKVDMARTKAMVENSVAQITDVKRDINDTKIQIMDHERRLIRIEVNETRTNK